MLPPPTAPRADLTDAERDELARGLTAVVQAHEREDALDQREICLVTIRWAASALHCELGDKAEVEARTAMVVRGLATHANAAFPASAKPS